MAGAVSGASPGKRPPGTPRLSFDIDRREAGYAEFRDAPFDPARARVRLRLARAAFGGVREWTEQIVDAAYDPRTKLLAAIHGEPRCRAA